MESLVDIGFGSRFREKRVLVTGHTGFKGSWLCEWLLGLGAYVHGLALDPLPGQELYGQLGLHDRIASDHRVDVRDALKVRSVLATTAPDFVFHLAAQPLVRRSYREPVETFSVNVMGTVHVLEAIRLLEMPCTAVMVTTDKCYENREWLHAYREEDPMGGHDPYSASKGCAELAVSSYRRSFFGADSPVQVASGRAGNVIGGGDWAEDRIVPDAMRALAAGKAVEVRNPKATRPWQHVLEPLGGYLTLAAQIAAASEKGDCARLRHLASGFNFGPSLASNQPVSSLMERTLQFWPGTWVDRSEPGAVHEASLLNLATDKAFHLLGWSPLWDFTTTVERTVSWYRNQDGRTARERSLADLSAYTSGFSRL